MRTKKIKTLGIFKPVAPDGTKDSDFLHWPMDRVEELILLRELLEDVSNLDAGSGVLLRMKRVIDASKKLMAGDINTGRLSFWQFLIEVRARDEGRE